MAYQCDVYHYYSMAERHLTSHLLFIFFVAGLYMADLLSADLKAVLPKSVSYQKIPTEVLMLQYLTHYEAYNLLLVNRYCNKLVSVYRKNNVCGFNELYQIEKANGLVKKEIIVRHHEWGAIPVSSESVIFDASGNYASGYTTNWNFSEIYPLGKNDHKFGLFIFAYPSCLYMESRSVMGYPLRAITTKNRIMSLCIWSIFNTQGAVDYQLTTWKYRRILYEETISTRLRADENTITFVTISGDKTAHIDGSITDLQGQRKIWRGNQGSNCLLM